MSPDDVDHARKGLEEVSSIRREGNPQRAYAVANELNAWLDSKEGNTSFGASYLEVRRIRGRLLLEALITREDFLLPAQLMEQASWIYAVIETIAHECSDGLLLGKALCRLGDVNQICRDFDTSIRCYAKALALLRDSDHDYRLRTATGMALDWAYMGQKDQFLDQERRVYRLIRESNLSDLDMHCENLQSLARAQARLGYERAFTTLEDNQRALDSLVQIEGTVPLRSVQLECSRLEALRYLSPEGKRHFESEAARTLNRLRDYRRFPRHEERIVAMMRQVLN